MASTCQPHVVNHGCSINHHDHHNHGCQKALATMVWQSFPKPQLTMFNHRMENCITVNQGWLTIYNGCSINHSWPWLPKKALTIMVDHGLVKLFQTMVKVCEMTPWQSTIMVDHGLAKLSQIMVNHLCLWNGTSVKHGWQKHCQPRLVNHAFVYHGWPCLTSDLNLGYQPQLNWCHHANS